MQSLKAKLNTFAYNFGDNARVFVSFGEDIPNVADDIHVGHLWPLLGTVSESEFKFPKFCIIFLSFL